jgi:hypothetical protein
MFSSKRWNNAITPIRICFEYSHETA